MNWDDDISGEHRAIAGSNARRVGVLAGPGTGKTALGLMRRVVRLLQEDLPGERIFLASFTRVAAADLRDKVEELKVPGAEDVVARTLHGYCFGLLARDSVLELTGRRPRILFAHERDLMLYDIGDSFGNIYERRELLMALEAGWAREITDEPLENVDPTDSEFEERVLLWLKEHGAMTPGEMVPIAYKYLRDNPYADERFAFDHIIVDEYQDLDRVEQTLLDLLAEHATLCVAGDDDQSIYSPRHAHPEGILALISDANTESHTLTECGRCPQQIVNMANSLIGHAPGRTKSDLRCLDPIAPASVVIVDWANANEEVKGIASAIARDVGSSRREPGDILVLTNWRDAGEQVRAALAELGVDAVTYFTEDLLSSDDAKTAMALLQLVAHNSDRPALRVLLGVGSNDGRSDAYQRLLTHCRSSGEDLHNVLTRMASGEKILNLRVPALVGRFTAVQAHVPELHSVGEVGLASLVDALFPVDNDNLAILRRHALESLDGVSNASGLYRKIVDVISRYEVPQHPSFVRIMSIHKSKGLTSKAVFVVGALAGILPAIPGDDSPPEKFEAAEREGRRLMYVAVTRAKEQLVISSPQVVPLSAAIRRNMIQAAIFIDDGNKSARVEPSPFILELGVAAPRTERGRTWLARY